MSSQIRYRVSGISYLARTSVLRGTRTIRSSGPTRRWRQFWAGGIRDVNADDGKIAGFEFENVRATPASYRPGTIGVRVRPDSAEKHN